MDSTTHLNCKETGIINSNFKQIGPLVWLKC